MNIPRSFHAIWLLAAFTALEACATIEVASTSSGSEVSQTSTHRRRRRRRRARRRHADTAVVAQAGTPPVANDAPVAAGGDANAGTSVAASTNANAAPPSGGVASIGAPVVSESRRYEPNPRWVTNGRGRGRIVCEGAPERPAVVSPQCPMEPETPAVVRAFVPTERAVLACNPPADVNGRLPVRALFSGAGAPVEVWFPRMELDEQTALCLGRALCEAHVPTFRSYEATVSYEFVVLLPDDSSGS